MHNQENNVGLSKNLNSKFQILKCCSWKKSTILVTISLSKK